MGGRVRFKKSPGGDLPKLLAGVWISQTQASLILPAQALMFRCNRNMLSGSCFVFIPLTGQGPLCGYSNVLSVTKLASNNALRRPHFSV